MDEKTYWDSFKAGGENILGKVRALIHEGNVRRVVVQHQGRTVAEFPLTAGVVGAVLAPVVAAIGALVALLQDCTIQVERVKPETPPTSHLGRQLTDVRWLKWLTSCYGIGWRQTMKSRLAILVAAGLFWTMATPTPVFGQQDEQTPHNHFQFEDAQTQHQHFPNVTAQKADAGQSTQGRMNMGMMASAAKLEELVKKMNAAQGAAKTDAMAELLTALVENHRTMCGPMMANMMSMMSMMGGKGEKGTDPAPPVPQR
jgi:Domain of unknown function (DUF4342)